MIYPYTIDKSQLFKSSQLFSLFSPLASSPDNFSSLIAENGSFSDILRILSLNSREIYLLLELWRETYWLCVSSIEVRWVCIFMKFSSFIMHDYNNGVPSFQQVSTERGQVNKYTFLRQLFPFS